MIPISDWLNLKRKSVIVVNRVVILQIGISNDIWNGVSQCVKSLGFRLNPESWHLRTYVLQKSEKINPAFKLQYLGLKFAVVDKVHVF